MVYTDARAPATIQTNNLWTRLGLQKAARYCRSHDVIGELLEAVFSNPGPPVQLYALETGFMACG